MGNARIGIRVAHSGDFTRDCFVDAVKVVAGVVACEWMPAYMPT
jgi:hypothetical protein